jgi:hypothetical protein
VHQQAVALEVAQRQRRPASCAPTPTWTLASALLSALQGGVLLSRTMRDVPRSTRR